MYDVLIIGGGMAGLTAAIYASRAGKSVIMFEQEFCGGQIVKAERVENYPGFLEISGVELTEKIMEQTKHLGVITKYEEVIKIEKNNTFKVETKKGIYESKTVVLATGNKFKQLNVPGEEKLIGRGIAFCANCDGAFYKDKRIVVVGGGNKAINDALYLLDISKDVTILIRGETIKAEKIVLDRIIEKGAKIKYNTSIVEFIGENKLEKIVLQNNLDKSITEENVDVVFLAIGGLPNTSFVKDILNLDEYGNVISGEDTKTNIEGLFVAGDCRQKSTRQLSSASSDGTTAGIEASLYIDTSQ